MPSKTTKTDFLVFASTDQDNDYVAAKLIEADTKALFLTQEEPIIQMNYVIKNDGGIIVGGIIARMYYWKLLYIDSLWVDEQYRNKGYGSTLLKKVEDEAKKLGCSQGHLDTFDFQAPNFYQRNGYEICGTMNDCPPGHKKLSLRKFF